MSGTAGMFISMKKTEPAHYMLKIESYSVLSETGSIKIESDVFEASGHKWRLDLYPNGNGKQKGFNHVSLHLIICDTQNLSKGWQVYAKIKFFVYDHVGQQYITFEGINGETTSFHEKQMTWGFDELISLQHFKESSKGYLFNDSCVFGAEVFIVSKYTLIKERWWSMIKTALNTISSSWIVDKLYAVTKKYLPYEAFNVGKVIGRYISRLNKEVDIESLSFAVPRVTEYTLKDRCLSMIKPPAIMNTYSWSINNFSAITENYFYSEVFKVGKLKWTLLLYPKGYKSGAHTNLSLYLKIHDTALFPDGWRVYAKYELRVKNQSGRYADKIRALSHWFSKSDESWGFPCFLQLSEVGDTSKGFLLNDRLIVEAKISVIGTLRNFI